MKTKKRDIKKVFRQKGTCSNTFFYLLNRNFGYLKAIEERAADPLAGGICQYGHQCGMLWGCSLAIGAEASRRFENRDKATGIAIMATKHVMKSFSDREKSINCKDVARANFKNLFGMIKYLLSGRFLYCFKLADLWAPDAIHMATEGLEGEYSGIPEHPISCASLVAKKLGATDEQAIMVAGFAGGMGLSGSGCGALSAAIWMKSIEWCKVNPNKSSLFNPTAKSTIKAFEKETGNEMLCHKICNQYFKTVEEHTAFIEQGGCDKIINVLTK